MNIVKRCKICGKILTGCYTCQGKIFNWRNVACCEKHFQEYIMKVEEGRRDNNER